MEEKKSEIKHEEKVEMKPQENDCASEIKKDENIQGIILTGNSGFFSAGLDVLELFPKKMKF